MDSKNPEKENSEAQNGLGTVGRLNAKREGSKIVKEAKKVTYADVVMRSVGFAGTAAGSCGMKGAENEITVMLSLLENNPIIGGKV